ncbi:hypothetical protein FACS189426_02070 [Bacteroidia bacterium]|nr:hypothetical protein FACS189426_02070 [Bacteroidia bacterium]
MYSRKTETKSVVLKNNNDSVVTYEVISIDYDYKKVQFQDEPKKPALLQDSLKLESGLSRNSFNQFMQYEDSVYLSNAFGNEAGSTVIATKYNSGSSGFNLTDVGFWFISESKTSGAIKISVSAGGASIEEATEILSCGSADYKFSKNEINGHFYNVKLDKPVAIYPDEDFFVIIEYPEGISRPQGVAVNDMVESVEGRYYYKDKNDIWRDLQKAPAYSHGAWLMYAAGEKNSKTQWLSVPAEEKNGSIPKGGSAKLNLQFNGNYARLGSQYADVILGTRIINESGDTINSETRIPVLLRLNEAPYFFTKTEFYVEEESVFTSIINIKDFEDDLFTVLPLSGSKVAQYTVLDSTSLELAISPEKGDAGNYSIKFQAVDEHKSKRELEITIHVTAKNENPVFIGESSIVYPYRGSIVIYNINDFFKDPDNDPITFTISVENPNIIEVLQNEDGVHFSVRPQQSIGTTSITITATDINGGSTSRIISIEVGSCVERQKLVIQKWNKILIVDNSAKDFEAFQWYKNGVLINGATNQYYSSEDEKSNFLDSSAEYFVRLITIEKDTIYTCPCTPEKFAKPSASGIVLKAYPNPVERSGILMIEKTSSEAVPGVIHVIDILGRVRNTIKVEATKDLIPVQMPEAPGLYIIKMVSGDEQKNFQIKVK